MNEKISIWVGYGKKEKFVDARLVETDKIEEFIADTTYEVRHIWGWKKRLVFKIRYTIGTEERVIEEEA